MHRFAESAPVTSPPLTWGGWLNRAIVCLGCVVAGGTLVALATPTIHLAAGAASARTNSSIPDTVLLDFTATWCGPCQQMSPIIDRLADQGYPVRKVDVDRERDVAERFGIQAMPTFVLLVNGREVMRQTGVLPESQLRRMVQQIPEWERELAARSRQPQLEVKVADRTTDPVLSIPVDLGAPQRDVGDAFAETPAELQKEKSKPAFGFSSIFGRGKDKVKAVAATETPVIRGNSPDGELFAAVPPNDPFAASVRLKVVDQAGVNFGSGTLIDHRAGQALILTCGHIFRSMGADGVVHVDVFDANRRPHPFVGKVVSFDLKADVGLVLINSDAALSTVSLATKEADLSKGEKVVSIGCGGGNLPSREELAVTAVNRYDGPDNIECTGLPVQGRSGGGLFRGKDVVGVCIAADPANNRGVYAALKPVYALVESAGYGHIFRDAAAPVNATVVETAPASVAPRSVPLPSSADPFTEAMVEAAQVAGVAETPGNSVRTAIAQSPDAEIIVIVRPRNPSAPSRVVVVNQATSKLLSYLMDDVGANESAPSQNDTELARSESLVPTTATEPVTPKRPPMGRRIP